MTCTMMTLNPQPSTLSARRGVTLIEMLVATAVTLLLVGMIVSIFGVLSERVSDARATIEITDRLRATKQRLQQDLQGITVTMRPPRRPEANEGYFEAVEGPIGPIVSPQSLFYVDRDLDQVYNATDPNGNLVDIPDQTVGDVDDLMQFTTRGGPFVGRFGTSGGTAQSNVAEVSWFLRGTTLYRRVLLVLPDRQVETLPDFSSTNVRKHETFYSAYDVSVRQEGGPNDMVAPRPDPPMLVANSLGDLTKRENRYGHQPWVYPHHSRLCWGALALPTLRECSFMNNLGQGQRFYWPFPLNFPLPTNAVRGTPPQPPPGNLDVILPVGALQPTANGSGGFSTLTRQRIDLWNAPYRGDPPALGIPVETITGTLDTQTANNAYLSNMRIAEDVILTDVIQFDVKCWDPGAPIFNAYDSSGNVIGTLSPGDRNYLAAGQGLRLFMSDPTELANQPIGYGAYVDLNYLCLLGDLPSPQTYIPIYGAALNTMESNPPYSNQVRFPRPSFAHAGDHRSPLRGEGPISTPLTLPVPASLAAPLPATYDTWSTHYERDGFNQDVIALGGPPVGDRQWINTGAPNPVQTNNQLIDEGINGIDDYVPFFPPTFPSQYYVGGIDDDSELEAPPPYPAPLRGVQVKIRVFERDTRQIREVTVIQDFDVD